MNDYRHKFMNPRRVLCTGNPNKPFTIASAVIKYYPNATFIHQSNGFDLVVMNQDTQLRVKQLFKTHNTFINASYIAPGVQSNLLQLCNDSAKICDVFNIGSTHEYDGLGASDYTESKINLRNKSLQLNSYRFKTCHIVVGGIKMSDDPKYERFIELDEICNLIEWTMKQRCGVPIVSIDQPKQPW
jgi:hypothetical protein